MKKHATLPLFLTIFALNLGFLTPLSGVVETSAISEELAISDSGDAFILLDKSYNEDESFVYTADLHFKNGQAGGIAFGSTQNEHYYVLNMDRVENRVKLLYFASNGAGGYIPTEIFTDYFIGNDKITDSELSLVKPRVATIENVNLKVILTREDDHAYVELFVEGIKRFGVDRIIDLNNLGYSFRYEGGYLGMNCFNSDVFLSDIQIGKSDYSYFSEQYRNQYHLQPFAKWSNDPNALCYYNGYYHVFYQTHPFDLYWGDMYWGHARSRDLIHFEFLPICLFPEAESISSFGPGNGYAWSGCAITYTKGMSDSVDNQNWFPNGNGNGILAIYTRAGALQDQVIISSDDEGLTWTKRIRIPQSLSGHSEFIDFRDPKVFSLEKDINDKTTLWGMSLSSMNLDKGYFLKSTDLLNWSYAGEYYFPCDENLGPECIGVGFLKDENGEEFAYLTNKSRSYILGKMKYDEVSGKIVFFDENNVDISTHSAEEMKAIQKPLDFGPDSYASQSFYISDPTCEFYNKDIVLNWFSGDLNTSYCTGPGEYANLRNRWNGGFTIPVEYGVTNTLEGRRITQKPITVGNSNLEKTAIVDLTNKTIDENSSNPLSDVHTHIFELSASITSIDETPISFRVDVGEDEYMSFGWNNVDGYYVDRTYLDDKGINVNSDWHKKYATHLFGDSNDKTFYVLSDNGGLEVFCENYSISFYFVTTASIYSTGASLNADNALINSLEINEIKSAYRKDINSDEGILYVSNNDVILDSKLTKNKFVTCYYSGNSDLNFELIEGEEVVSYTYSNQGINLSALNEGEARFLLTAGKQSQYIDVHVYDSSFISDLSFKQENIISGYWNMVDDAIIGEKLVGNGFLLANESGDDFTFTSQFAILSGTAASLVFRASSDMSSYLVANYDSGERIVKLWSTHGELARSEVVNIDANNIVLSVNAVEKNVRITLNGQSLIDYVLKDNEPLSGRYGVNVFSGRAKFTSFAISKENYEYSYGDLSVKLDIDQFITEIYNVTLGNRKVDRGFYYQNNGTLYIKDSYFTLLDNATYKFKIIGSSYSFTINVKVEARSNVNFVDLTISKDIDLNVYIGRIQIKSLKINEQLINSDKYSVNNYTLKIDKDCFEVGENNVVINDTFTFKVTVNDNADIVIHETTLENYTPEIITISISSAVLLAGVIVAVVIIIKRKNHKNEKPNN